MADEPAARVVEEALRAMEGRDRLLEAAFQRDATIQRAGAILATPAWMTALDALPKTFVETSSALRAIEALGAHQSAQLTRLRETFSTGPLFNVAENIRKTFLGYQRAFDQIHETVLRSFRVNREVFDQLAASARRFAEQQRETDEQLNEFVLRHGWPVPLSLPGSAYRHIVSLAARPKREVTAAMVHWFRPQTKVFRDCAGILLDHELLDSRRPLIRQALRAHRRGDYYLVINALMPLVEGVLVDAMYQGGAAPESRGTERALAQLKKGSAGDFTEGTIAAVERLVVSGAAGMGLFASVRRTTWAATGEPRSLNRHAILHGFARRYASEANALKMILLMDVLVQVAD